MEVLYIHAYKIFHLALNVFSHYSVKLENSNYAIFNSVFCSRDIRIHSQIFGRVIA